ncbi:MAG: hypothetical protein GXP24_09535 [Planctomycetes bacterium]|nr:hypothetical protein [Planctomycetota bacterium]
MANKPQRGLLQGSQQLDSQPPQASAIPQLGSQPPPQASATPQEGSQQLSATPHDTSQQLLGWQHLRAARRARNLASRPQRFGLQQLPQGSQQASATPQEGSQQSVATPQLGSQLPQPPNMPKNALAFGALLRAMATLKPIVDRRR